MVETNYPSLRTTSSTDVADYIFAMLESLQRLASDADHTDLANILWLAREEAGRLREH